MIRLVLKTHSSQVYATGHRFHFHRRTHKLLSSLPNRLQTAQYMSFLKIKKKSFTWWWISSQGTSTMRVYLSCPSKYNFYKSNLLELAAHSKPGSTSTGQACWSKKSCLNTLKEDNQLTGDQQRPASSVSFRQIEISLHSCNRIILHTITTTYSKDPNK